MDPSKSQMTIEGKKVGNYLLQRFLGKGQFGKVWKAKNIQTGEIYAIKQIDRSKIDANPVLKRLLQTEVSIMNEIKHRNILHLYDHLVSKNNYYLVIDYCNEGDFENYLKSNNLKYLDEKRAVFFLKQIMNGFKELRKHQILHRDFKLANLFINNDTLVIGDFGFAKSGQEMAETKLGTPLTMAYEILTANSENSVYNSKADLWSVGIVYYQLLFGKTPFYGYTMPELIKDIKSKVNNLSFPLIISNESKDLIQRLLKTNPKERIDWHEFFNHPLFEKYGTSVSNLNDLYTQLGDLMMNTDISNIEDEFQQNKQDENNQDIKFMDQENLIKYGEKNQFSAQQIEEQSLDESAKRDLVRDLAFQEICYRYNHEKNIILFLIYTVKKTQSVIKKNYFEPMHEQLFMISILLMKKALTLNQCHELQLDQGNNVYYLNQSYFNQIKQAQMYDNIKKVFKGDKRNIEQTNAKGFVLSFQNIINSSNPSLVEVDDKIKGIYQNLMKYITSAELLIPDKKRIYYLILYSIKLCINCERIFPYLLKEVSQITKFNWVTFYNKHEKTKIL